MIVLIVVALSIISLILAANAYYIGQPTFSRWIFSAYWFSCFDNVSVHALPIKEASSTNEN